MRSWKRSALYVAVILPLLLALLLPGSTASAADGPLRRNASDPSWAAAYFNNTSLDGEPILTRGENNLDWSWGFGSPHASIQNDFFSARWTRHIHVTAGVWRFTATTDDGMRIWIDDQLVLDQWNVQAQRTFVIDRSLSAGHHLVRVEYFEENGEATARLRWDRASGPAPAPQPDGTWRSEYFNNRSLQGDPAVVREEPNLDFNWGLGSPASDGIQNDNFSARFTRTLNLAAGTWRFTARADDGVRLWVGDNLIIDQWREQAATSFSADINLSGGNVPVRLEYFEATGGASVRLDWSQVSGNPPTGTPAPAPVPPGNDHGDDEDDEWRGEYFENASLNGSSAFTRHNSEINFDWGYGGPRDGFRSDWFSVRWTRTMWFPEGQSTFVVEVDDGARLYVDGDLIIDKWIAQGRTRYSERVNLSRGQHTIVLEYMERTQLSFVSLRISRPNVPRPPIGNIITCAPSQPENNAWIKLYRLDGNNNWYSTGRGIGSVQPSGFLKIDGLPVDQNRFGGSGEPYRVEMWVDGSVVLSTGNFQAGEPEFRVRAFVDNFTPWGCSR